MNSHYRHFDQYGFRHLFGHLYKVGRFETMGAYLLTYEWLQAKLVATDVAALLEDYRLDFPHPRKALIIEVAQSLGLSAYVLGEHKEQLSSQLLGRLSLIHPLRKEIKDYGCKNGYLRPLTPSLTSAIGALERIIPSETMTPQTALALSSDDQFLYCVAETEVRCLQRETGSLEFVLREHYGQIGSLALTRDNRLLIASFMNGQILCWDLGTRDMKFSIKLPATRESKLVLDERNQSVLIGSVDGVISMVSLATGSVLQTFEGNTAGTSALLLSPDGKYVISGSTDKTIRIWDRVRGDEIRRYSAGTMMDAVFINDREVISGFYDGSLVRWSLADGPDVEPFMEISPAPISLFKMMPNGRHLVLIPFDFRILVIDWVECAVIHEHSGHSGSITTLAITSSGDQIISASIDGSIRFWKPYQSELSTQAVHRFSTTHVLVHPNQETVFSASLDNTIKQWDVSSCKFRKTFSGHTAPVHGILFSRDGNRLISFSSDHSIKVWDIKSGTLLSTMTGHTSRVMQVRQSFDGRWLVSSAEDPYIRVWNIESGKNILTLFIPSKDRNINALEISADNRYIYHASVASSEISIWDTETKVISGKFMEHSTGVRALCLSQDGQRLFSGSRSGEVFAWDLKNSNGKFLFELESGRGIDQIMEMENGQIIVVISDRDFAAWDVNERKLLFSWSSSSLITSTTLVDGSRIVVTCLDNSLRVWNLKLGQLQVSFFADNPMSSSSFVQKQNIIVAGDFVGKLHFLYLDGC